MHANTTDVLVALCLGALIRQFDSTPATRAPTFGAMQPRRRTAKDMPAKLAKRMIVANDNVPPARSATWIALWWPFLVAWTLPPALTFGLVVTLIRQYF